MNNILAITEKGMINDIYQMNLISNNLANTNTAGYKRELSVLQNFDNHLANLRNENIPSQISSNAKLYNPIFSQTTDYQPGVFKYTGNKLSE